MPKPAVFVTRPLPGDLHLSLADATELGTAVDEESFGPWRLGQRQNPEAVVVRLGNSTTGKGELR